MVEWWWIPAAFGIAAVAVAAFVFLTNIKSFFRYIKISSM